MDDTQAQDNGPGPVRQLIERAIEQGRKLAASELPDAGIYDPEGDRRYRHKIDEANALRAEADALDAPPQWPQGAAAVEALARAWRDARHKFVDSHDMAEMTSLEINQGIAAAVLARLNAPESEQP